MADRKGKDCLEQSLVAAPTKADCSTESLVPQVDMQESSTGNLHSSVRKQPASFASEQMPAARVQRSGVLASTCEESCRGGSCSGKEGVSTIHRHPRCSSSR